MVSVVWPVIPPVEEAVADVLMLHFSDDEDAYNAAAAVVADPAVTVRRRRVLSGEWQDVKAALDELPEGSIIAWADEDGRCVALKCPAMTTRLEWFEAGHSRPSPSEGLARNGVPIEVLA